MSNNGTILVADDEQMLRRALSRVLARAGFSTILAEDGQQAIDLFAQEGSAIDLVVLDMNMPIKNGVQAFYGIRELDPTMKVVIASGESRNEVLSQFGAVKPNGILQKPFVLGKLVAEINLFLES